MLIKLTSIISLSVSCNLVWADRIGGSPRADFSSNELSIPCVQIKNFNNANLNDQFFDVILDRRGNSFNYELTFAESENQAHCQRVAEFAKFDDDDFDDDNSNNGTKILVSCEKRPNRSEISVEGKNLATGNYSSRVTSGGESISSSIQSTEDDDDDEVEFDYDSAPDDIEDGDTVISADFIQNGTVSAEILDSNSNVVASIQNVVCAVRN